LWGLNSRIKAPVLEAAIKNLMQPLTIVSPPKELTDGKRIDRIFVVLFEQCCLGHREDGERFIQISVSDFGMNHFFNLENVGYLKYKLQNLTTLSSGYSITLFNYCFNNKFRGSWEVELGELKNILNAKEESYAAYKVFNSRILSKAVNEINSYTDIDISYTAIKTGKTVSKIQFTVDYKDVINSDDETVLDSL
jgi:plasmid replication initiation protein